MISMDCQPDAAYGELQSAISMAHLVIKPAIIGASSSQLERANNFIDSWIESAKDIQALNRLLTSVYNKASESELKPHELDSEVLELIEAVSTFSLELRDEIKHDYDSMKREPLGSKLKVKLNNTSKEAMVHLENTSDLFLDLGQLIKGSNGTGTYFRASEKNLARMAKEAAVIRNTEEDSNDFGFVEV